MTHVGFGALMRRIFEEHPVSHVELVILRKALVDHAHRQNMDVEMVAKAALARFEAGETIKQVLGHFNEQLN
jgi:hypothetical protein